MKRCGFGLPFFGLIHVILELFRPAGMAQFPQSLGLDLTDTLTGDVELLAHFLQSAGAAVLDTEAEYFAFVDAAFEFGFEKIAKAQLSKLTTEPINPILDTGTVVGYYAGDYAVVSTEAAGRNVQKKQYLRQLGSRFLLTMNDKYKTWCYSLNGDQVMTHFSSAKPKAVYERMINLV